MNEMDKRVFQMTSKPGEPISPEDLAVLTESVEERMSTLLEDLEEDA